MERLTVVVAVVLLTTQLEAELLELVELAVVVLVLQVVLVLLVLLILEAVAVAHTEQILVVQVVLE
jgi:hypothetical protein